MEPFTESTLISFGQAKLKELNNGNGVRITVIPDEGAKNNPPLWSITPFPSSVEPNVNLAYNRMKNVRQDVSKDFIVEFYNFLLFNNLNFNASISKIYSDSKNFYYCLDLFESINIHPVLFSDFMSYKFTLHPESNKPCLIFNVYQ